MVELTATPVVGDLLPLKIGKVTLKEENTGALTLLMPFKGHEDDVAARQVRLPAIYAWQQFEPSVTPELLDLPNVTLLPHIGSATAQCRGEMAARGIANIRAFLDSGQALDPCTP